MYIIFNELNFLNLFIKFRGGKIQISFDLVCETTGNVQNERVCYLNSCKTRNSYILTYGQIDGQSANNRGLFPTLFCVYKKYYHA